MERVKIFDNERKVIVKVALDGNNKIQYDYFRDTFPTAIGLFVREEDGIFSIPRDENKNFTWNWDNDVVYDLIYPDSSKERTLPPPPSPPPPPPPSSPPPSPPPPPPSSPPPSSPPPPTRNKSWSWMETVGGLFSSTKVPDQYKKMN